MCNYLDKRRMINETVLAQHVKEIKGGFISKTAQEKFTFLSPNRRSTLSAATSANCMTKVK